MLRLESPKTFKVLEYILENIEFSQTGINSDTSVSLGRVNKIIKWLLEKEIIIKETGKYKLIKPNLLIETISFHNTIKKKMSFQIGVSKKELIRILKKSSAVFCLDTAIETYDKNISKNINSNEVHLYYEKSAVEILKNLERGDLNVNLYESSLLLSKKDKASFTSKIRTIIDLASVGNKITASDMIKKIFGTLQ